MADSKIDSGLPVIRGCVFQGTTAEQAGFRVGDRLLSINDHPMADFNDPLRGALRSIKSSVTTKTPFTVCSAYIYTHTCTYMCVCVCVCVCMFACMCVCVYVCMYVCVYACMYA